MTENKTMNEKREPFETEYDAFGVNARKSLTPLRKVFQIFVTIFWIVAIGMTSSCAVRAAFPMNLPEAQGRTFYEFLGERWETLDNTYPEEGNFILYYEFGFLTLLDPLYASASVWSVMHPDSRVNRWLKRAAVPYYSFILPKSEAKWTNAPKIFWGAVERESWVWLVILNYEYPYPQPPTK